MSSFPLTSDFHIFQDGFLTTNQFDVDLPKLYGDVPWQSVTLPEGKMEN